MAEIDRDQLSEEFDIDNVESEVKEMVEQIDSSGNDVEYVLAQNINRANRILDRIEHEINNGNFSARISEVASQLVNSVTGAASQISSGRYNTEYLQLRRSVVELEKMKLGLKYDNDAGKANVTNQNIIVTDRESLLKLLKGEETKKLGYVKQIENKGENDE